jgi:hypothetical protein
MLGELLLEFRGSVRTSTHCFTCGISKVPHCLSGCCGGLPRDVAARMTGFSQSPDAFLDGAGSPLRSCRDRCATALGLRFVVVCHDMLQSMRRELDVAN